MLYSVLLVATHLHACDVRPMRTFAFSLRGASRSTPLCSGWTVRAPASTCGSVLWSTTPSSACAHPATASPPDRTSSAWAPASGSGWQLLNDMGHVFQRMTAPFFLCVNVAPDLSPSGWVICPTPTSLLRSVFQSTHSLFWF